jgi:uncharacterized surface protein with fasciclin (FAS1) repeats
LVQLAASVPSLSTLVTAIKAADLVQTLSGPGPFTVFAPNNGAFAALPSGVLDHLLKPENKKELVEVLTYHVAAGQVLSKDLKDHERIKTVQGADVTAFLAHGKVYINNAEVIAADNLATNGVAHIIEKVLLPPHLEQQYADNIVQLALATPDLSTLVTALKAGDLVSALEGPGPFTVFAPTNEAFAALPPGVLEKLLKPENKKELVEVLTYHVASGNVQSKDLKNHEQIKTLEGADVQIFINHQGVFVNYAQVIKADIEASNGVVHLINKVLLPPHLLAEMAAENLVDDLIQISFALGKL